MSDYLTVKYVANYLGVSEGLIYKKVIAGELSPILKIGTRNFRIPVSTLRAFETKSEGDDECQKNGNGLGFGNTQTALGMSQPDQALSLSGFRRRQKIEERRRSFGRSL